MDVGARGVHSGLRTLRAQALRVGTCALTQQTVQLAKHANSIPSSNRSLFGEGLCSVIVWAASTARDYADMADGLAQGGMYKPLGGMDNCKRRREGSPPPFRGGKPAYLWVLAEQVVLQREEARPRPDPEV